VVPADEDGERRPAGGEPGQGPPAREHAHGDGQDPGDQRHRVLGGDAGADQGPGRQGGEGRAAALVDQPPGPVGQGRAEDVAVELAGEGQEQRPERQGHGGQVGAPGGDPAGGAGHQHQEGGGRQRRHPERHPPEAEVALGPVDPGRLHAEGPAGGVDRHGEERLQRRLVGVDVAVVLDLVDEQRPGVGVEHQRPLLDQGAGLGEAHQRLRRGDLHQRPDHHHQQQGGRPPGRQGAERARHVPPSVPHPAIVSLLTLGAGAAHGG
jgi:hypothetical protein